ncbi:hypothetical protein Aple_059340 [Acrocarpospora pleiomorpha]|uniref:Uncharacterized protein n=1 Tax=Acrocarpospora pleiomorpha TaxID=90975 RepID=A0A5M3XNW3_9ACTN|nr:hypothetical protein [Acrocarpospora pleiomorpha]GES23035.1 hypothetical protein Aple_059340 [Acrocarpospora pleiomorpha]
MRALSLPSFGRRCLCGAALRSSNAKCHKCRARARWYRRKAHHDGI